MLFSALFQRLKATVQAVHLRCASRRKAPVVDSRLGDVLDMLERDARLKGEMLDELRQATRVGKGSTLHRSSQVDLAELVRTTTESFLSLARERHVALTARCAASSVVISADARDLTLIVSRVIAGAIASSPAGGRVDSQLSLDPDWVSLLVRVHAAEGSAKVPTDFDALLWQVELSAVRELTELYGGVLHVGFEGCRTGPMFSVRLPGDRADTLHSPRQA